MREVCDCGQPIPIFTMEVETEYICKCGKKWKLILVKVDDVRTKKG
jgi:hypothetical protein